MFQSRISQGVFLHAIFVRIIVAWYFRKLLQTIEKYLVLLITITDFRKLFVTSKNYLKILRIFLVFRGVFNNFKNYLRVLRTLQENIVEKKSNNVGKQCPFTSIAEKRVLSLNYCKEDYNGSMTNTQCLRENLCYQYFFWTIGS